MSDAVAQVVWNFHSLRAHRSAVSRHSPSSCGCCLRNPLESAQQEAQSCTPERRNGKTFVYNKHVSHEWSEMHWSCLFAEIAVENSIQDKENDREERRSLKLPHVFECSPSEFTTTEGQPFLNLDTFQFKSSLASNQLLPRTLKHFNRSQSWSVLSSNGIFQK